MLWLWIAGIFALYILVVFILSPFIIPFLRTKPLPTRIPKQLEDAIAQIYKESSNKYEFVRGCSQYLLSTIRAGRMETIFRLHLAFQTDTRKLLSRRGFMHCTQLNYLLRLMLAKSPYFTDDDIRLKRTFLNFSIHQYVQVKIAGQWYDVDLWGMSLGVPLGRHASWFR